MVSCWECGLEQRGRPALLVFRGRYCWSLEGSILQVFGWVGSVAEELEADAVWTWVLGVQGSSAGLLGRKELGTHSLVRLGLLV